MTDEVANPLEQFDTGEILAELRRRNMVLSVWDKEDFSSVILEDDDLADLSEEEVNQAADLAIGEMGRKLEDHLGSKGNEFIEDLWHMEVRDTVIETLRKRSPAL